jgi:hypothetical protein
MKISYVLVFHLEVSVTRIDGSSQSLCNQFLLLSLEDTIKDVMNDRVLIHTC